MELWNARYLSKVTKNNVPVYPAGTGATLYNKDVLKLNQYLAPQKSRTLGQTWPIESADKKRFVTHEQILAQNALEGKIHYPYKSANLYDIMPPDVYRVNLVGNPSFYGGLTQPVAHRNTGILDLEDSDFINWKEQTDASLAGGESNAAYLSNALHAPPKSGLDPNTKKVLDTNVQFFSRPLKHRQLTARTNKGEIRFLNLPEYPNSSQYEQIRSEAKAKQDQIMQQKVNTKRALEAEHYMLGPQAFEAKYNNTLENLTKDENILNVEVAKPRSTGPSTTNKQENAPSSLWLKPKEEEKAEKVSAKRPIPQPLGGMDDDEYYSAEEGEPETLPAESMDDDGEGGMYDRDAVGEMISATLPTLQTVGAALLSGAIQAAKAIDIAATNNIAPYFNKETKIKKRYGGVKDPDGEFFDALEGYDDPLENMFKEVPPWTSYIGSAVNYLGNAVYQNAGYPGMGEEEDLQNIAPQQPVQPGASGNVQEGAIFYDDASKLPSGALEMTSPDGKLTSVTKLAQVLSRAPKGIDWFNEYLDENKDIELEVQRVLSEGKTQVDASTAITQQSRLSQMNSFMAKNAQQVLDKIKQKMFQEVDGSTLNEINDSSEGIFKNKDVLELQYNEVAAHVNNAICKLGQIAIGIQGNATQTQIPQTVGSYANKGNPIQQLRRLINPISREQKNMNSQGLAPTPASQTSNLNNSGVNGSWSDMSPGQIMPSPDTVGVDRLIPGTYSPEDRARRPSIIPSAQEQTGGGVVSIDNILKMKDRREQLVALHKLYPKMRSEDYFTPTDWRFISNVFGEGRRGRINRTDIVNLQKMINQGNSPEGIQKYTRSRTQLRAKRQKV